MEELSHHKLCNFAFLALQLLDKATLFSKKEVLEEYDKNKNEKNLERLLLKKSIYPNGDELGFFNSSKYTLKDILNQKEIENTPWYTIKNAFNPKKIYFHDDYGWYSTKAEGFERYLRDNHPFEYIAYENFLNQLKKEFDEYLNGFSTSVQEFFRIIPGIDEELLYNIIDYLNKDVPINPLENIDYVLSNKETFSSVMYEYMKDSLKLDEGYVNYDELDNFLTNVLFEDSEFKERTSILYILPETPFIYSCLNYINNINKECIVDIYIITHRIDIVFLSAFCRVINNVGKFVYHIRDKDRFKYDKYEILESFFDKEKRFDFIVETDYMHFGDDLFVDPSYFDVQVSSRMMAIHKDDYFLEKDDFLKEDLLESLILIPYKNTIRHNHWEKDEDVYKLVLFATANYNKSEKQKNKFLVVDKNPNYDVTSREFSLEDYKNIIKSNGIYSDSYKLFSEFVESNSSKIYDIDRFLKNDIRYIDSELGLFHFTVSSEMYDVKMRSKKKYFEIEYFEDGNRIIKNLDYPFVPLYELTAKHRYDDSNHNLYMTLDPKYDDDKIVFFDFEIGNKSHYSSFKADVEKVSSEYLYYYLNSELGKKEFFYHKRGFGNAGSIRVPIPPKEIQAKIVETMNRSEELFDGMRQLKTTINKNFFNYEGNLNAVEEFFGKEEYDKETQELSIPNNWEYAHSGLIWPLAITYLLATSGGFEKVEKANNLLRLFEFTVAFNSYVLISGIPDEIYEKNKTRIWELAYDKRENDEKFAKRLNLSFGSWDHFHGILQGIYKKEFTTGISKEFYMNLLNKKIRNNYTNLKNERNEQFHGGISNAYEAETLLNELNAPKLEIFNHLNSCYEKLRLYYTTGRVDLKTKEYEIIFLNGPYSMPIYSTITSEGILEPESLYLHDIMENKFTKLNDNLIKFKAMDEMKHEWRLYIFIGFETDKNGNKKAKYRCYQRKEDDLLEDINLNELM